MMGQIGQYRAYFVGTDGHFIRAVELFCPDDEAAKERANQLVDGFDVERWQADRKIAQFPGTELPRGMR
jgi:hypothetical protein